MVILSIKFPGPSNDGPWKRIVDNVDNMETSPEGPVLRTIQEMGISTFEITAFYGDDVEKYGQGCQETRFAPTSLMFPAPMVITKSPDWQFCSR